MTQPPVDAPQADIWSGLDAETQQRVVAHLSTLLVAAILAAHSAAAGEDADAGISVQDPAVPP